MLIRRLAVLVALMTLLVPLAASSAAPNSNLLQNPSLESATKNVPDCWVLGGYGTNGFAWTRTTDAHSGSYAERLDLISLVSGDRKLVSKQWGGDACSPTPTAGRRYVVSAWYKGTAAPVLFAYYRTSTGSWKYWTQSARLAPASSWTQASWTTPSVPSGAKGLSVGMGLVSVGSVTMDDFALIDASSDTTPPTVAVTAPASGANVTGTVALGASASDDVAIDHVDFLVDGQKVGSDTSAPYSFTWNSEGVAAGAHSVDARAADSSGNVTTASPVPVTVTSSAQAPPPSPSPPPPPAPSPSPPPPPPPSSTTFHEGFAPDCAGSIFATASWDLPLCDNANWNSECHPCHSVAIPDSVDGDGYAMELDPIDYNASGTMQAWLHNPLTVNGSWGSAHRVDIRVKPIKWGLTAQANCSWAGGPKIFMGRPQDVYETSTYTVELNICEGHAYIQKKVWGNNDCGKDPRAVDCGAGGTWYNLKTVSLPPASFGQWHTFSAVKQDNPDGSVLLTGYRDGVQVIQMGENPQPYNASTNPQGRAGSAPLLGGREGWRSNMSDWLMDSYNVTVTP